MLNEPVSVNSALDHLGYECKRLYSLTIDLRNYCFVLTLSLAFLIIAASAIIYLQHTRKRDKIT